MTRAALLPLVAVALGAAAPAHVRVNDSIAGVRLGMTRAQVAARVGKPYGKSIPMRRYECPIYVRNPNFGACFDTRTRRAVSLSASGGEFCVVRPRFCFQQPGGVARLKQAFGRRLIGPVLQGDYLFYQVVGRRGGRRVQTAFVVDTSSSPPLRGSSVIAAYISFCGRQLGNLPRCPPRR